MNPRGSSIRRGALCCSLLLTGSACDRLASFDLEPGESYCGNIALGSQYRQGLTPRVQMRMGFDSDQVDVGGSPGVITTYDAEADVPHLLDAATLRPIDPIAFDALADMEMGDGRERNLIYAASPSTPESEALLVIISLRTDDVVEVRLLRPGHVEEDATPERRPIYGLFQLTRRQGDCGF